MQSTSTLATLLYFGLLAAYFWSFRKLYYIIDSEHPEWLSYEGEPSIFYQSLPPMFDPNISLRVLRVAFTRRSKLLVAQEANRHVLAVRVLLAACLVLIGIAVYAASDAP